jgi:hypothetical protein
VPNKTGLGLPCELIERSRAIQRYFCTSTLHYSSYRTRSAILLLCPTPLASYCRKLNHMFLVATIVPSRRAVDLTTGLSASRHLLQIKQRARTRWGSSSYLAVNPLLATCTSIRSLCVRERACEFRVPSPAKLLDKTPPTHTRRTIGCVSRNGIFHCLPFSLVYHIPQTNYYRFSRQLVLKICASLL